MSIYAQTIERFNSFSYNVNDGLLQSHVDDMAFDKNNFGWLSFTNGIQKFDGHSFTQVQIQPGLPDDKGTNFFTTSTGDLLISHTHGISKYEVSNNKFSIIYQNEPGNNEVAIFLGEDEKICYFFTGRAAITGIDINSFKITSNTKTGFKDYKNDPYLKLKYSGNIISHTIGLYADSSLHIWDLKHKQILYSAKNTMVTNVFKFWLNSSYEISYFQNKKDNILMRYNFITHKNAVVVKYPGDENKSPRVVFFNWKNKNYLSYYANIFETDTSFGKKINEPKNFQNEPITGGFVTNEIKKDKLDNLYLLSANNGIRKIVANNYPIYYYGTEKRESNFVVSVLPDKKANRVLVGTQGNGLLIFDTLQHLVKQIRVLPGDKNAFTPVSMLKVNDGSYLLFCWDKKLVWQLNKNLSDLSVVQVIPKEGRELPVVKYFSNFLYQNDQVALVHSQGSLYKIDQVKKTILVAALPISDEVGCMFYNKYILAHSNDQLLFIDTGTMTVAKKISLKNTGGVRCFATDKEANIYVGSNKGIFKLNVKGDLLWMADKKQGLPDECIYAMATDKTGIIWCSTNKGIFKIAMGSNVLQLTKEDGLQENEFNTNVVAKADDGELFFGGVNGTSSFYPQAINPVTEKPTVLFTKIKINNKEISADTAAWNISRLELPYHQNSLAFDFIAMAGSNPVQYIYQYKMDGIDKEWLQNTDLQTVRYFLPPGEYVFKIYASRFFNKDAKPMKEIRIIINPPVWKTWWFITSIILLLLGGLAYAFNRYNKNKYQKKLTVLENEHRIQLERERISRDLHDSIGAYANAVLYNTELLQKENDIDQKTVLMNDLKFASKDIITSLRETVWALKKENYTAEECLLRIKNFIQVLSRYYKHIQFKAEGDASAEKILHHTNALHVVRIVQEAVTNAVKHAAAANISLTSKLCDGRWELTVVDDGMGFDYEAMKHAEHGNGLLNMNQRATESGLVFTITSTPGSGTKMTILV